MRYRPRTLMIVLAILPPLLWLGWGRYQAWKAEQDRQAFLRTALIDFNRNYLVLPFPLPVQPSNQDDQDDQDD